MYGYTLDGSFSLSARAFSSSIPNENNPRCKSDLRARTHTHARLCLDTIRHSSGGGARGAAVHQGGPVSTAAHAVTVAGQSVAILGGCGDVAAPAPLHPPHDLS